MVQHALVDGGPWPDLERVVPTKLLDSASRDPQRSVPSAARDLQAVADVEAVVRGLPTRHELFCGDGRRLEELPDESVHLALTSPPYWTLKTYPERAGQLGSIEAYEEFLDELDRCWCPRALRIHQEKADRTAGILPVYEGVGPRRSLGRPFGRGN